jgi:hypothetical protein
VAERRAKNITKARQTNAPATKIKHGMAAWRGMRDTGAAAAPFFFIFAEPMNSAGFMLS